MASDLLSSCTFYLLCVRPDCQPSLLPVCLKLLLSAPQHGTQAPAFNNKGVSKLYHKAETAIRIAIFADSLMSMVLAGKEVERLEIVAERQNLVFSIVSCMTLGGRLNPLSFSFPIYNQAILISTLMALGRIKCLKVPKTSLGT